MISALVFIGIFGVLVFLAGLFADSQAPRPPDLY